MNSLATQPRTHAHSHTASRAACADPTCPSASATPTTPWRSEGRAFQVDATCADVAISREPLIPCVPSPRRRTASLASRSPSLASVLGAAAAARAARALRYLRRAPRRRRTRATRGGDRTCCYVLLKRFYDGARPPAARAARTTWAASAAVLLNSIFTCGHQMADCVIARGATRAARRVRRAHAEQAAEGKPSIGAPLPELVRARRSSRRPEWWAPFARAQPNLNAWRHGRAAARCSCADQRVARPALATLDAFWAARRPARALRRVAAASPDGSAAARRAVAARGRARGDAGARGARDAHVSSAAVRPRRRPPARGLHPGRAAHGAAAARSRCCRARPTTRASWSTYAHNFSLPDLPAERGARHPHVAQQGALVQGHLAGQRGGRRGGLRRARRQAGRVQAAPRGVARQPRPVRPLCLRVCAPRPDRERARGDRAAVDYAKERKRALDAEGLLTRQQIAADELFTAAVLGA